MKRKEIKKPKKINHDDVEQPQVQQKNKKVFSHKVMQMQSLYGNRIVERTMNQLKWQNELNSEENIANSHYLEPEFVPIYRSWTDKQSTGMRMYLTRNQFHFEHRNERSLKNETKANGRQSASTEYSDESIYYPYGQQINNKQKGDPEEAKKYYSSLSPNTSSSRKELSEATNHEGHFENYLFKLVKYGRFSFIGAYPYVISALRKRKKQADKQRKKSKMSRFSKRFSTENEGGSNK